MGNGVKQRTPFDGIKPSKYSLHFEKSKQFIEHNFIKPHAYRFKSQVVIDTFKMNYDSMSLCLTPRVEIKKAKGRKSKRKKPNMKSGKVKSPKGLETTSSVETDFTFDMDNRGCLDADYDSEPDRSNPLWKIKSVHDNEDEPSLEVSSDSEKFKPTIWEEIMLEYEHRRQEFFSEIELSKPFEAPVPVCSNLSAVQYLEKYIFPLLCPALEETLFKAKEWDCLMIQKCRFNGLDYISELLWNRNPFHPERRGKYRDIFDIPFVIIWLYYNPRPIYPLSWLWSKEEAIIVMQTYIRRYLVCKKNECSEMREFWKTLKTEEEEKRIARRERSIEQIEMLFSQIFEKLIADAVFEVEWKKYGCRCVKKPCRCVCKCQRWCKCCRCYNIPIDYEKAETCSKTCGHRGIII